MMEMGVDHWMGQRIRELRISRGLSQTRIAEYARITQSFLSRVETGSRVIHDRRTLIAIAQVLGVRAHDLTRPRPEDLSPEERTVDAAIPEMRAALDGAWEERAIDLGKLHYAVLNTWVDNLARARMNCEYATLTEDAAEALATTQWYAEHISHDGFPLFGRMAVIISMYLRPLGHVDFAIRLAERGMAAAVFSEDETLRAAAAYALSQCSVSSGVRGLRQRALEHSTRALDRLGDLVVDDSLGTWALMLQMQSALVAASLGKADDVDWRMDDAARMAREITSDPEHMDPSPANVSVWRVAVALEHDPVQAAQLSRQVNRDALRLPQRRVHALLHQAKAHAQTDATEKAIQSILEAERIGPQEVRSRGSVRELVGSVLREARKGSGSDQLRGLAGRLGCDPYAESFA